MPRTPSSPTRSDLWLDLVDDGWSTLQIAEAVGVSQRWVRQRVAEARERRESGQFEQDRPEIGDDDATWLELVDQPGDARPYYDLATDSTSHDGTGAFVLVGTGRGGVPRRNRLGTGRHVDTGQSYRPRDDGLKGGKG